MLFIIHLLNDSLPHLVGLKNVSHRRLPHLTAPVPDKAPPYDQKQGHHTENTQDNWPTNDTRLTHTALS